MSMCDTSRILIAGLQYCGAPLSSVLVPVSDLVSAQWGSVSGQARPQQRLPRLLPVSFAPVISRPPWHSHHSQPRWVLTRALPGNKALAHPWARLLIKYCDEAHAWTFLSSVSDILVKSTEGQVKARWRCDHISLRVIKTENRKWVGTLSLSCSRQ